MWPPRSLVYALTATVVAACNPAETGDSAADAGLEQADSSADEEIAVDVAAPADSAADVPRDDDAAVLALKPHPDCSWDRFAADFLQRVAPHLTGACASCHDMTAEPAFLKAPGPPWLHPSDTVAVTMALAHFGTIDALQPLQSRLLLKPLDPADGGLLHTGGVLFAKSEPSYADFVGFLATSATCLMAAP